MVWPTRVPPSLTLILHIVNHCYDYFYGTVVTKKFPCHSLHLEDCSSGSGLQTFRLRFLPAFFVLWMWTTTDKIGKKSYNALRLPCSTLTMQLTRVGFFPAHHNNNTTRMMIVMERWCWRWANDDDEEDVVDVASQMGWMDSGTTCSRDLCPSSCSQASLVRSFQHRPKKSQESGWWGRCE